MLKMKSRLSRIPANVYLFKVNNRNTRKRFEICSKLTIKRPEPCQWRLSAIFIVNVEPFFIVSIVLWLWTNVNWDGEEPSKKYHYRYCKCYWFNRGIVPISGWLRGTTKAIASNVPDARQNIATGKETKAY